MLNERLTLPQFQGCGKGLLRQGHVDNQRSANFRRWTSGVGRAANGLGVKAFDALRLISNGKVEFVQKIDCAAIELLTD